MKISIRVEDNLDLLLNDVPAPNDSVVELEFCSVDTATQVGTPPADKVAEWVQDHSNVRAWLVQAADVASWTKDVLGATLDATTPAEVTFIHIQAVALPSASNETLEPAKFGWEMDVGAGAVDMGEASAVTFANLENNVITEISLKDLTAIADRKVLVVCAAGANKV